MHLLPDKDASRHEFNLLGYAYSYAKSSWQSKEIQVKLRASKEAYVSVSALRAAKKVAIISEIHVARGCSRCKKIRLMFPHDDVSFLTKAMAVGDSRLA